MLTPADRSDTTGEFRRWLNANDQPAPHLVVHDEHGDLLRALPDEYRQALESQHTSITENPSAVGERGDR